MKQKISARFVAAASAMALALTACSSSPPAMLKADGVERVSAKLSAYPAELAQLRASARKLGAALLADGGNAGNGNVVSSPGSLLIALHTANGLFVDKGVPTGEGYLQSLARHYGTGVYPVDFQDEAATKPAMDAWVNQNTGGRIKKAPTKYDRRNTFSVLNAVYFASAWKVPFDPADTAELPFTTPGGGQVSVPTMSGVQDLAYAQGAGWQAVDLPYAEGFVMRLVLPDAGSSRPGSQDVTDAARALEAAAPAPVQIFLPRWDHKSDFELRQVFTDLGLQKVLQTETDFDAIQRGLKIQEAAQSATITVAEKGTIAAAVTQINARAVSGVAPMTVIHFDRPFQYEIVHAESGLPLFMGRVSDPRPAGGS